jgi:hypothetical protein
MNGLAPVKDGRITIRGISFSVDEIRAMMLETGGVVVNDENLNLELDMAMYAYRMKKPNGSASLVVDAIPGVRFVPKRIRLHHGIPGLPGFNLEGVDSNKYLFFAVRKVF